MQVISGFVYAFDKQISLMKSNFRKIIGLFVLSGCFLLGSCVVSKSENKQDSEDFDRVREIQNQNVNNPRDYLRAP